MKGSIRMLPLAVVFSMASTPAVLNAQTTYDWRADAPDANWTQGDPGAR